MVVASMTSHAASSCGQLTAESNALRMGHDGTFHTKPKTAGKQTQTTVETCRLYGTEGRTKGK
jgi:hypothetical protein